MKDGLKDECRNIMQFAFLPEPEEGASGGLRITIPGEDIPDAPGRCREGREKVQPVCQHQQRADTEHTATPHRQG